MHKVYVWNNDQEKIEKLGMKISGNLTDSCTLKRLWKIFMKMVELIFLFYMVMAT
jgi:hypothetical protein